MNARVHAIVAALKQLQAALPGCPEIMFRDRFGSSPGFVLHVVARDDAATHALAAAFDVTLETSRSELATQLVGSEEEGELYVLISGPVHDVTPPVDDVALEVACVAVAEAGH